MHSGRMKRQQEHKRGHSLAQSTHQADLKTVGEYALHHLFTSFIAEADERIERCMPKPGEPEPRVENVCGPGADPAFDQLISSLGHINRHKPKSLIDAVIHWRKRKADRAHNLMNDLETVRNSVQLTQRTITTNGYPPTSPAAEVENLGLLERDVGVADRRSRVSIYILCRVLIEIIGQTTMKSLEGPDNTAARLEEIIYEQLKSADPDHIATSPLSHSCWVIRAQLLGVMSGMRFEEVSDKFIKDLEKAQKRLSIKGVADPKLASKTSRLVYSMRWLKVRSYPEEAWDHSCDMLQLLAKFFAEVHGRLMKHAYAELFEQLLLPIAGTATSELNMPKWKEVLALVQPKITQMLTKQDHWPYVFPLQAVLLCVSPAEQFAREWLPLVASSQPKARDRSSRSHALKALCRLVWRYLYRLNDSPNAVAKKLDEVVKQVFQGGKRGPISTDPAIADPLIQLTRIIGYKHQDLCFRTIIFPLMNSELFSGPEHQLKIENLDPEKTVIGIRAFLAVMSDLEKDEAPSFPTSFECDALLDPSSRSPTMHRRTRSQGFSVSAGRTERLSRPVIVSNLNETSQDYYAKFCKILGQLTIICDNTFGGQAALDEKFTSHTPKTPMAEAFTFNRQDTTTPTDLRQHYYDLLHVAVEALPRCVSKDSPINSLVNLLCVGTAHVQSHIASSSAQSLKSIARQGFAQQVTIGFARFIFNFDDRYATVSDGSLLGPGHIESTLTLYVELLQIWIDDIQRRARKTNGEPSNDDEKASRPLDLTTVLAHVDEVESHGLFFLCSPSRTVRAIAVNVLQLVTKFDTALGKPSTRIISILEGNANAVIDVDDDHLAPAERGRLQKGSRKSGQSSILIELCSSDLNQDATLWFKIFPNLIRLSSQICLHAVALTRELVCQRLLNTHKTIAALADTSRQGSVGQQEPGFLSTRPTGRLNISSPDTVIEQWKIHLIFACTTLTNIGSAPGSTQTPKSSQSSQHTRKSSKSSSTSHEKIASATELFSRVVPCLAVPNPAVRRAAVMGLGATNATLYHALLEALYPYVAACSSEAKERLGGTHQRTVSSPRRSPRTDYMRVDVTHLLSLTCHLLQDEMAPSDTYALEYLVDYTKNLRIFLSDAEVQIDLTLIKLKTHFCTLLEGLYDYTRKLKDSSRWMSFQSRQASFALMEDWCVRTTDEAQVRRQDEFMRRAMMDRDEARNRGNPPSSFRKDIHELSNAALSAMASLCAGPLILVAQDSIVMQFDVRRLLAWVDYIFDQQSDRTHAIGRRALCNLITYNLDQPFIMSQAMRRCYLAKTPKALASCFDVVTKVLIDNTTVQTPFWKILCVGLYTLGNEDSAIRMKSARLLRTLEERQAKTSKLQDLDISVSDKTTAVYKLAQFEVSQRLAKQHAELAFWVFSEFSAYFNELGPDHQRNMVSAMLPWIQTIELQLDQSGTPTANTYMLLVNMFEITVKSSIHLHNEIQALWQALATGPYGGNVQLIVEFVKDLCLDRKEANFVIYAKQIVVFVSKTPAGASVVDHLLQQITPRNTNPAELRRSIAPPPETASLPYVADISHVLPSGEKQARLSISTLSMILLVDLVVSPFNLSADRVHLLLSAVLFLWDFQTMIVQDQARELLVHLMHELIISKIEPGSTEPDKQSVEDFIEAIRKNDPKVTWTLAECDGLVGEMDGRAVPEAMTTVVDQVINIFSIQYPDIREGIATAAVHWGANSPVRGVACSAFRIFRCTSTTANAYTLADILLRLSNTIARDDADDAGLFTLEILTTLKAQVERVTPLDLVEHPQFFWTTCACLDTIHEKEFQLGLSMLDLLLNKMDLSDPGIVKILLDRKPKEWQGSFEGLAALVYKGVRSSQSMFRSLDIMEKLIRMPSNAVVGGEDRLLYTLLANLPRYLHYFDDQSSDGSCLDSAEALALAAESQNYVNLVRSLRQFARGHYRIEKDFLAQCVSALRNSFFPAYEFSSLVFLLGMVNNNTTWTKVKTMQILSTILADVDMRKPEIASQGPDLISPLLRLLQTEHCQQALDVLDNVIDMTGTPLDNKHLRMSMAGSHSSKATRKEYDNTKSLYGIPEESGWSIPMPAIHSRQTQNNTYYTANSLVPDDEVTSPPTAGTPEVEFHVEEDQDSYFGDHSMIITPDEHPDVSMNELALKLDSLDDFFDEQAEPASSPDRPGPARYPSGLIEERENLYDEQALPILHRSLQRNTSVTSFQTGFAELRYPQGRDPMVMNPGAFAQNQCQSHTGNPTSAPIRPGLHNRSITTPAEVMTTLKRPGAAHLHNDIASGDEAGDEPEPFSDDELFTIGRAHTTEEPNHGQHTVKPAGFKAGFRSGLRRLASTSGRSEAARVAQANHNNSNRSPRVPKVPAQYLSREQ